MVHSNSDLRTLVDGQSVGILAATAIGSELTQKTLDTFHAAGTADVVIEGVERIQQCLNNSSTINRIFFKVGVEKSKLTEVVYTTIGSLVDNRPKWVQNIEEKEWLKVWKHKYGNVVFPEKSHVILSVVLPLKKQILNNFDMSIFKRKSIWKSNDTLPLAYSPLLFDGVDFYNELLLACTFTQEFVEEMSSNIIAKEFDFYSKLLFFVEKVFIPRALNIHLFGIPNALQIIEDDSNPKRSIILCNSFATIFDVIHIDPFEIVCNKTSEMCAVYGIEVARECLLVELSEIMTKILPCHIEVVINIMTWTGRITSITRYSARKTDVLKRMTFEESVRNAISACIDGEVDLLSSFSSKIVTSKRI
jgi:hypothetical protein